MIDIEEQFKGKAKINIGRLENGNDIVVNQTLVSRNHCTIERFADGNYKLTDHSKNGTLVNGINIHDKSITLNGTEKIIIGYEVFYILKPVLKDITIRVENLEKTFGNKKIGLRPLSFKINEGEFVAIMGPTGCGKSTLLKCINGSMKANAGIVEILGINLYGNFNFIKHLIGYVPQDDIVNKELTVINSLTFAARLRLPKDSSKQAIEKRIEEVLESVNLNDAIIKKTKIAQLSGGQRKRLSIAVELLSKPKLLFLDEPTSPLDPETIEEFLQCLKNLTANGTTIMMVTHKPDDLAFADKVIWMANGGYMVYSGNTKDYLQHFDINRNTELYALLKTETNGLKWYNKWNTSSELTQVVKINTKDLEKNATDFWHQYKILAARYLSVKLSDSKGLLIQLVQAPLIGILLTAIFYNGLTVGFLFMMAISAIWFGIANSAKEIVDDTPIYVRERQFNISIVPYLLSKITVLSLIGGVQVLLLLITSKLFLGLTGGSEISGFIIPFITLTLITVASTAMGLLLSALVNTTEKAMTIQPLILIPQILLAGIIYPLKAGSSIVAFISYFTFSRWGTQAMMHGQIVESNVKDTPSIVAETALALPDNFSVWKNIGSILFDEKLFFGWSVMIGIGLVLFAMTYKVMRNKDEIA